MNNKSFEDREKTLKEIKVFVFQYIVSLDNCFCFSIGN